MEASILINRAFGETRVALLEDGAAAEVYVERDHDLGLVGNVYKGRVTRVLPGMQAAFVDIGLDRAAFLYVDDVLAQGARLEAATGDGEADGEHEPEEGAAPVEAPAAPKPSISELIREGQELVVQVSKDPLGTKGARVTTHVTLAGRYLVFMPTTPHVGISKRITDEAERKRLRTAVETLSIGQAGGFIVRTEGSGLDETRLKEDMGFLRTLWAETEERTAKLTAPALILPDLDLVLRATRDLFTREVGKLTVDDAGEAQRIKEFVRRFQPDLADRVEVFDGAVPIFDHYGVEGEIERALQRKVGMKSGASIVIDQAEALTAIDVNTGRFVGKQNLEATILRTNLEAVREIVTQLRLRNIGGIIVIDFIDMESPEHRERVHQALVEELLRDRAKTHVLPISGLGVIEMTRKRVRESLGRSLTEACPYCEGRGRIRSRTTTCHDIFRELVRQARRHPGHDLVVSANPEIAAILTEDKADHLAELERSIGRSVVVEARGDLHHEAFRVQLRGKNLVG
ncbi:MAG: Rne/Rng family ribonuclease [Myxococcota bacterium]